MGGRWHISYTLPDGQRVTADYRDPITKVMERAWAGELSDLEPILAWQADNRQQIEACQEGRCGDEHDVI
jgi:hypothetical protein